MSLERVALLRRVEGEPAWSELPGVRSGTLLQAGPRVVEHLELDSREGLDAADGLLHEEIFAWQVPAPGPAERAAILLGIRPGQEQAYREWLASDVIGELEKIWHRNDIYRHDVLANGTSLVAFYECKSRFAVLKAFREPEALAILFTQLAPILDLDPTMPISLFEEPAGVERIGDRTPA